MIAGNGADPFNVISTFKLLVTNEGNVPLSGVLVTDLVDLRLDVSGVEVTTPTAAGGEDCNASAGQSVSCTIPTLAAGESAEITVSFAVDASVPEALGVSNTADVEGDYTDDHNNSETVDDASTDTINILTEIELDIVKTFYRFDDDGNRVDAVTGPEGEPTLEQGTNGFFELTVSNSGPSDAVDVLVTDTVNGSLTVVDVQPQPECVASIDDNDTPGDTSDDTFTQDLSCTFDIPVGDEVVVTVEYTAAPFLDPNAGSPYGTQEGDDFRFVFVNGYILEGSSDTDGAATLILTAPDGTSQMFPYDGTKNEVNFDPSLSTDPNIPAGVMFTMHLSCSDAFIGGWGQSGGPTEGVDTEWQISSYSILRYNQNGFFKGCGDVVEPADVPNTAFADGTDSNSPPVSELVSDTATVQVIRQLKIEIRNDPVIKGKKMDVLLNNTGEDVLTIT
ncbi:MAG: DUF11 domain-containing protein [Gammaproteobacteria bacterium]|nr:DUF11 domain-containing protein [Gammaproteobacteria bacterium]MDH3464938.1 DUF11 domain-containing protein [Gammaproteobacteria bacterium]